MTVSFASIDRVTGPKRWPESSMARMRTVPAWLERLRMRTSPLGAVPMSGGTRGSSQRELVAVTAHEGVRGGSQ